ncbi:hypothetical protein BS50DRAFT_393364 [Corynespora cassiicola Philippines]|uniref:Fungal STAND N-terminal Goodbye domain-containing protein n=1 Tax=Corynespora cassiicola Philippines TaxID=1448308 RepID=A0A2T2NPZ5_CORCC|nr:hypothetical protein BS50DRAFT_393364 [Corynespora cassiicola Philippines]
MSATEDSTFRNAFKRFLDALPENERNRYAPCASFEDLREGLNKLQSFSKHRQGTRLGRWSEAVDKYGKRLKPYFDSTGILVQSNPEYAAIFWGSLRLIFQLAENITGFFEKIMQLLDILFDSLPIYRDIESIFKANPTMRIIAHIEAVYEEVFSFFQIVAEVSTKSNGRAKKKLAIFFDLTWTPVDVRFGKVIERLKHRQIMIRDELLVFEAKNRGEECKRAFEYQKLVDESLKNDQKDRIIQEIQNWLQPPVHYQDAMEKSFASRESGTCDWIYNSSTFQTWLNQEDSSVFHQKPPMLSRSVFWIRGNPGCGKTVLASSIIQHL